MSWQNTNTSKKVISITKPLEQEQELLDSIPENAIVTAHTRTTKTAKITYVLDKKEDINNTIANIRTNTKPIKLERVPLKVDNSEGEVLAIANIADFHLNRFVDGSVTNGVDYDLETAKNTFMCIVDKMVKNMKARKVTRIILNLAGDFLNSDTKNATTTAGTPQDDDVTWQHAFITATGLLEYACKEFSKIAPVEYYYVRGNHDEQTGFYLTAWLDARFSSLDSVNIDISPKPRHVITHGTNIIILTHGDKESARVGNLPFVEQNARVKVSDATNIEVIMGHLHSTFAATIGNGVKLYRLPSACPVNDRWSYDKSFFSHPGASVTYYDDCDRIAEDYINTKRIMESIIYSQN